MINRKGFTMVGQDISPSIMSDGLTQGPQASQGPQIPQPGMAPQAPKVGDMNPAQDKSGTSSGQYQGQMSGGLGAKPGGKQSGSWGPGGV